MQRKGAGDADALALTAAERVRVAVDGVVGQAAPLEQVEHLGRASLAFFANPWTISGSATSWSTVIRGLRLA